MKESRRTLEGELRTGRCYDDPYAKASFACLLWLALLGAGAVCWYPFIDAVARPMGVADLVLAGAGRHVRRAPLPYDLKVAFCGCVEYNGGFNGTAVLSVIVGIHIPYARTEYQTKWLACSCPTVVLFALAPQPLRSSDS